MISSISRRWPANLLVGGAIYGVIRKTSYIVKTSFIGFACGGGAKRLVTHCCVKEEIMSSAEKVTWSETLW